MNDLIEAAKAVIARWERSPLPIDRLTMGDLCAAVERAESDKVDRDDDLFAVCMYGARTERERIKNLIATIGTSGKNECWDCCEKILEKIDEVQS